MSSKYHDVIIKLELMRFLELVFHCVKTVQSSTEETRSKDNSITQFFALLLRNELLSALWDIVFSLLVSKETFTIFLLCKQLKSYQLKNFDDHQSGHFGSCSSYCRGPSCVM